VSKLIKLKYKDVKIIGNVDPPRSGAFEITLNNELIFSKFELNRFPTENEISKW
jgi:selT/selW/selH-like putative selenoprotein